MKEKMICRGDLFYYDFGDNSGSVQSGERPVLVVQADDYNQNAPTIIVAAVTSVIKKRYLPSHIILGEEFGLKKPSMVLLEQIRTVNREDLREYIGTVDDDKLFRQINATLKKTFGLWVYKPEGKENIRCLCPKKLSYNVPLWHKPNLSIEEASIYSNIGTGKLYEMTEKQDCPFVLWIGSRRMIKRKIFEEYIANQYSI